MSDSKGFFKKAIPALNENDETLKAQKNRYPVTRLCDRHRGPPGGFSFQSPPSSKSSTKCKHAAGLFLICLFEEQ